MIAMRRSKKKTKKKQTRREDGHHLFQCIRLAVACDLKASRNHCTTHGIVAHITFSSNVSLNEIKLEWNVSLNETKLEWSVSMTVLDMTLEA